MAITGAIPLPGSGIDALEEGAKTSQSMINSILDNQLNPYRAQLAQAQAEEARGKALQSQMLARLLQGAGGTGGMSGNQADLTAALLHIPVQTQVIDGKLVRINPLTGTSISQIGETPAQKRAGEAGEKVGGNLEDEARNLNDTLKNAMDLQQLLTDNPSLTGIGKSISNKLNLSSDPNLAKFQEITTKLQAGLAKLGSSRGGIQALKWAALGKPDISKPGKYNLGMVQQIIKETQDRLKNIKGEYKTSTNRELPIDIAEIPGGNQPMPSSQQGQSFQPAQQPQQGVVILYKKNKQGKLEEYSIPANMMQRALQEGFTLGE